ncbi:YraN family protein [Psychromonas sp. 14N.309.X.WAT.B.A12]|uniref:YraN family protein n=1 Tax=Psychromonas sp. 14N.309.X.WAT.B.A12 TaxID=2998322 RepID=UPI0025B08309|nr:YraN family protein [Psychromonas sp. 14N.309.X.WAT.B.A12]MDN2663634.1 YraN family protein [Psychromonas sp. 14N.309.X.WAT.B.A12]
MKLPRLFQASNTRGVQAEQQALAFLQKQGLLLMCQNFYCRFGEIDLIMSDQGTLVFIEVRYRKNQDFGGATASITPQKQRKLIKTAKHYLSQLDDEPYCRFDVIAISESAIQPQWIQDAFQE